MFRRVAILVIFYIIYTQHRARQSSQGTTWRSTEHSVFAIVFCLKNVLRRTEMRTRERKESPHEQLWGYLPRRSSKNVITDQCIIRFASNTLAKVRDDARVFILRSVISIKCHW